MRIKVSRSALVSALSSVVRASDRRSSIPILAHVRLAVSCGDGGMGAELVLTATDLSVTIETSIASVEALTSRPGATTAPAKALLDTARKLGGDEIEIEQEAGKVARLVLRSGAARVTLDTMPADDYPPTDAGLSRVLSAPSFEVSSAALRAALGVENAASEDDTRPHLHGVLLEIGPGHVRAVATDGHRIAKIQRPTEIERHGGASVGLTTMLLPVSGVAQWLRALPRKDETVEIACAMPAKGAKDRALAALLIGPTSIVTVIETAYAFPPYEKVIPMAVPGFRLDASSLAGAIERARASSPRDNTLAVVLSANETGITVIGTGTEEHIPATMEAGAAPAPKVGINAGYLLDALKRGAGEVVIQLRAALDPITVTRPDVDTLDVIMPTRT